MLIQHPKLTIACLATSPVVWTVTALFSKRVKPAYQEASQLNDQLSQRITESLRGIHVIKAFGRESDTVQRFHAANDSLRDKQRHIFFTVSTFVPSILFLSQANLIVLLAYGGLLSARGELAVGTGLVAFATLLQQVSGQVAGIGNIANTAQQSLRAANRVFEILDAPVSMDSTNGAPPPTPGPVRFESVCFGYAEQPVLREICLEAKPGECMAFFGPTGTGKTTLLSLIPRFYDPDVGRITLSGTDLRDLDLKALRRSVGMVFQDSFLFSTTVAENIAFGFPEASPTEIERAARLSAAHEFICQLPNGYDTVLGEAGIGLSGGQRQRLAIARAILHNPQILLLDDPTAAVDSGTESEILQSLETAMAGRTTFLVSHRPAMLRKATRIFVLEHGEIVQSGTHTELLNQPGSYRDALLGHTPELSGS
jgi:ATP-binding cassette subfamily B protein